MEHFGAKSGYRKVSWLLQFSDSENLSFIQVTLHAKWFRITGPQGVRGWKRPTPLPEQDPRRTSHRTRNRDRLSREDRSRGSTCRWLRDLSEGLNRGRWRHSSITTNDGQAHRSVRSSLWPPLQGAILTHSHLCAKMFITVSTSLHRTVTFWTGF